MNIKREELDGAMLVDLYYGQGKTLQEIGDLVGITRERVRQLMESYQIPRQKEGPPTRPAPRVYNTLDDYFAASSKRKRDNPQMMAKLMDRVICGECGNTNHLHMHHIKYPAMSINDIQILCASCHMAKHRKGMTYANQLLLYLNYTNGAHYKDLMKQFGISQTLVYNIIRKIKKGYGGINMAKERDTEILSVRIKKSQLARINEAMPTSRATSRNDWAIKAFIEKLRKHTSRHRIDVEAIE